jgi:GNAT superfamily N-acetyltransferase
MHFTVHAELRELPVEGVAGVSGLVAGVERGWCAGAPSFFMSLGTAIGPVYQGYLPPGAFCAVRDGNVRRLRPSDQVALLGLRSACSEDEWEHSALSTANDAVFGYFCNGELVAAAGAEHWTPDSLSPGVLSRPDIRGRGMGTAVVSAVVESAMISGKIPLYQTLSANAASVAVAEHLGYRHYGIHVAVRPRSETS